MQIVEDTPTSCLFRRERRCPLARQPHAHLCVGLPGPVSPAKTKSVSAGIVQTDLLPRDFSVMVETLLVMHWMAESYPAHCARGTGTLLTGSESF